MVKKRTGYSHGKIVPTPHADIYAFKKYGGGKEYIRKKGSTMGEKRKTPAGKAKGQRPPGGWTA